MYRSRRLDDIQPFHVMELLRRARELEAQGRDIIHMEVGEPDFRTPPPVVEAATRFLAGGDVHYTPALGLPALREAIARFYHDRFGADVAPERIIVTAGASGALMLALAATTDPGDEWLLPDPGYPSNRHLVRAFEGVARALAVDAASRYQPPPGQVERRLGRAHPRAHGGDAVQPHRHAAVGRRDRRAAPQHPRARRRAAGRTRSTRG